VDESTDYKALYVGDAKALACSTAGRAFAAWLQGPDTARSPASLLAARAEAARV
jgi:hypothetical protein